MILREEIIAALHSALETCDHVHAAWLGGSDATGRTDELSDIDLQALVDDDRIEAVFELVENALGSMSPFSMKFRVPEPTWHGHSQVFFQLENASPFHLIDFCAMKMGSEDRFMEPERHGSPLVLFDRGGHVAPAELDRVQHLDRVNARREELRAKFALFSLVAEKATRRNNTPEAAYFYFNGTLRMLVDLLRIRYCPDRFDFGMRYLADDLPEEWFATITRLSLVGGLDDIVAYNAEARRLFTEVLAGLDSSTDRSAQ